jgi:uroporphyrinogen-III synthase
VNRPVPVWFTRQISGDEVQAARQAGIEPVVHPLISVKIEPAARIFDTADTLPAPDALLLTSRNAVDALLACRVARPGWPGDIPVFTVGSRTAGRLHESGVESVYPQDKNQTGSEIAEIMRNRLEPGSVVWHPSSSIRRPEAGRILAGANLDYRAFTVYTTTLLRDAGMPAEPWEYVVFYSPSAVEAFFSGGRSLPEETITVAIGETTAEALAAAGIRNAAVPDFPSTESVIALLGRLNRADSGAD